MLVLERVRFEQRRLPQRLAIDESIGSKGIEFKHQIAHDLQGHAAHFGSIAARRALVNRRQSQKTLPGRDR